jgi:hypothetical protein
MPDFATIAVPLHSLTKKNVAFIWTEECEKSFHELKQQLTTSPVLAYPDFSEGASRFILDCDASDTALDRGVLSQEQADGSERVIAYGSNLAGGRGELLYDSPRDALVCNLC